MCSRPFMRPRRRKFHPAQVFWLHRKALEIGARLIVHVGTAQAHGTIKSIEHAVDPGELAPLQSLAIGQIRSARSSSSCHRRSRPTPMTSTPSPGASCWNMTAASQVVD